MPLQATQCPQGHLVDDALVDIAMPARASVSTGIGVQNYPKTIECRCPYGQRNAHKGVGVQYNQYTNECRSLSGLRPKRSVRAFGKLNPINLRSQMFAIGYYGRFLKQVTTGQNIIITLYLPVELGCIRDTRSHRY